MGVVQTKVGEWLWSASKRHVAHPFALEQFVTRQELCHRHIPWRPRNHYHSSVTTNDKMRRALLAQELDPISLEPVIRGEMSNNLARWVVNLPAFRDFEDGHGAVRTHDGDRVGYHGHIDDVANGRGRDLQDESSPGCA